MNPTIHNAHRPTATWKLWAAGVAGGLVLATIMFNTGGDDGQQTSRAATQAGNWGIRLLFLGSALAGGWASFRRKGRQGNPPTALQPSTSRQVRP